MYALHLMLFSRLVIV